MQTKLKILIGDVRHETKGRHSNYLPIGIGYIASNLIGCIGADNVDIKLFTNPDLAMNAINEWQPNIVAMSNYVWNSRLSYRICSYAKSQNNNTLCVLGGPEFHAGTGQNGAGTNADLCHDYLIKRPSIDYYCFSDGEVAFAHLVKQYIDCNSNLNVLKQEAVDGSMSIDPNTNNLIQGKPITRIGAIKHEKRDKIPSPYLLSLLDNFLDGTYIPSLETARVCPFKYTFCDQGKDITRMSRFSTQRICEELDYIAEKISATTGSFALAFHNSNWGMYEEDHTIAIHLKKIMDKYDWPKSIEISTPKNRKDKVININKILKNRVSINLSQHSMNRATPDIIERSNYSNEEYLKYLYQLKNLGKAVTCELIVPLSDETKETFLDGVKYLLESGIHVGVYTLMLLIGSSLGSRESQERYSMIKKYRVMRSGLGEYNGERVIEVEPICCETVTMPYEDYLFCRSFSFVTQLLSYKIFDTIRQHLNEFKISFFDFALKIHDELVNNKYPNLSNIYTAFKYEAEKELFDSESDIIEFYSIEENWNKLMSGELGDNLLRKYITKVFILDSNELFDFVYDVMIDFLPSDEKEKYNISLKATKLWSKNIFTVNSAFSEEMTYLLSDQTINLDYDVHKWFTSDNKKKSILEYESKFIFYYDKNYIKTLKEEINNLYGSRVEFGMGKILDTRQISDLFRQCRYAN